MEQSVHRAKRSVQEQGEASRERISALPCSRPFSGRSWHPGMKWARCYCARAAVSRAAHPNCECANRKHLPLQPRGTRGSKRSLPTGSGCFCRRNLSLGSGTTLNITSFLSGSVPSPGRELLVSWGSLRCKRHLPGPCSQPLAVPSVLRGDPGASSPAPAELGDLLLLTTDKCF